MHSFSLRHQGDVLTDQVDGEAAGGFGVGTEAEAEGGVSSCYGVGVEGQSVAREVPAGGHSPAFTPAPTPAPAAAPVQAAAATSSSTATAFTAPPQAAGAGAGAGVIDTNPKEVPEYSYVLEDDLTNPATGLAALGKGAFTWAAGAWPIKTVFVVWVLLLSLCLSEHKTDICIKLMVIGSLLKNKPHYKPKTYIYVLEGSV